MYEESRTLDGLHAVPGSMSLCYIREYFAEVTRSVGYSELSVFALGP